MKAGIAIAEIKRAEQHAKDRCESLGKDPSLRAAAQQQRAVHNAMKTLRLKLEDAIATEDRDS